MLQVLRTRTALIIAIVAAIVGLYALAGFVIAPRLARNALLEDIPKVVDAKPSVGEIRINPFLFQVEVRDFALAGAGGEKLLGAGRLFVDFQLSSIWHRAYTFKQVEIDSPYINAVVARDGNLNLLALRPKPAASPPPPPTAQPIPALRVASFTVSQGSLSYEDESRPSQFAARLEPINFQLRDFVTGVQGGQFTFTGVSKLGERVEWHGHMSVQPIESDGELSIQGLHASTLWEYLEDKVNFVIDSGTIDVQSTYRFALKDTAELEMNIAKVAVSDLAVKPRGSDSAWVALPGLTVAGTTVNLAQRLVQVDSVALSGLKLTTWLEPNGTLNLMQLAAPPTAAANAAAPAAAQAPTLTATQAPPTAPAPAPAGAGSSGAAAPWRVELKSFDLADAELSAEDRSVHPAAKVVLAPFSVNVGGASLDLSKPVEVKLDTRVNGKGSISVSGQVTPQPASASLKLKLSDIDLTTAQPYIGQRTSMTLRSGRLGAEAQVTYSQAASPAAAPAVSDTHRGQRRKSAVSASGPSFGFAGDVDVEDLHTVDNSRHDDLVKWERVDVRGLNFQQNPDRLDIAEVLVRKPYARVIIEADTTLNVANALKGPGAGGPSAEDHSAQAPPKPAKSANAPGRGADGGAPPPASPAMPMAIKKVQINDGVANFTDLSVAPNFSAAIQKLEGSVLGLSSKPGSRATVDLKGAVDAFSPVSIQGQVNPLGAPLYVDLGLDFRNMELSIFNPYSGKFAGYNITKGKLTTELHYKVDGRKLDAQHHVIIDQLEFGDKTDSKNAVSLPVKLAVALLKDRNGVIDLNLPVTGSLDDPKFRIAPIVWKVFVNILEKAVTAPFALLGSLFGGGPDLQFIDFHPGAGTIDASQQDKVKAIVKALQERPQLKIEVPIAAVPELDRPALVAAELDRRRGEAMAQLPGRKKPAPAGGAAPDFNALDPPTQLEVLMRMYRQDPGGEPQYPDSVTSTKEKTELISAKIDFLNATLRERVTVADDRFRTLGEQRAQALQQALLTDTQIDPSRVFLVASDKATAKDGAVRLEMSLR